MNHHWYQSAVFRVLFSVLCVPYLLLVVVWFLASALILSPFWIWETITGRNSYYNGW